MQLFRSKRAVDYHFLGLSRLVTFITWESQFMCWEKCFLNASFPRTIFMNKYLSDLVTLGQNTYIFKCGIF